MSQRIALIISAALTAFVLVLSGAVIGRVGRSSAAPAEAIATDAPEATAAPETAAAEAPASSSEAQLYLEREAAYRELVGQANERLQAAYDQLQAQAAAPSAPVSMSADQAAALAGQIAPGLALLGSPQLVTYEGVLAYEILLSGGVLYIDAQTGQVLFNGVNLIAPVASNFGAGSIRMRGNSRPEPGQGEHAEVEHEHQDGGGESEPEDEH